ncbi:MAG: hypothetical protein ACRDKG_04690, partial [Actinomycetota bacterium]
FRRLHKDGQTIMLVTHDVKVAENADRIVKMRDGRIENGESAASGERQQVSFGTLMSNPPAEPGPQS